MTMMNFAERFCGTVADIADVEDRRRICNELRGKLAVAVESETGLKAGSYHVLVYPVYHNDNRVTVWARYEYVEPVEKPQTCVDAHVVEELPMESFAY